MKKFVCILMAATLIFGCAKNAENLQNDSGSIVGFVSDNMKHELQRAKITLTDKDSKKEVTETGTDGLYEFQHLVLGKNYTIVAELSGYYADTLTTKVDKKGVRGDFMLKEIALRLNLNLIDVSTKDYADFIIYNDSKRDMTWIAEQTTDWLNLNKTSGTIKSMGAEPIHITLNRSQIQSGAHEATIVINSSHEYAKLAISVVGNKAPSIYTYGASNSTFTSFQVSGAIDQVGIPAYTERGFVYSTSTSPSIENAINIIKINGTDMQKYYATIQNLCPSTTYYYRAYSKNPTGVFYGNIESYSTRVPTLPGIATLSANNIFEVGATLNGLIATIGNPAYTEKGFIYATFSNPTVNHFEYKVKFTSTAGAGAFNYNISGLSTTTYYYRTYAITPHDTVYGGQITFLPSTPYVSIGNLGILKNDATDNYTNSGNAALFSRSEAIKFCNNLIVGSYDDWRLPTIEELEVIYNNRSTIGGFMSSRYWSVSRTTNPENNLELNIMLDFSTGNRSQPLTIVTYYERCRCVRTLP